MFSYCLQAFDENGNLRTPSPVRSENTHSMTHSPVSPVTGETSDFEVENFVIIKAEEIYSNLFRHFDKSATIINCFSI